MASARSSAPRAKWPGWSWRRTAGRSPASGSKN